MHAIPRTVYDNAVLRRVLQRQVQRSGASYWLIARTVLGDGHPTMPYRIRSPLVESRMFWESSAEEQSTHPDNASTTPSLFKPEWATLTH